MTWKISFIVAVLSFAAPSFAKQQPTTAVEEQVDLQCYFLPPEGWDIAAPETLSPKVKIAFFKKNNKGFSPTINLAIEDTSASSSEYLKAVKSIHEQDRSNHWRALGKVRTAAGLAQLTEIDTASEMGPIRLLQLILLKNGHAYILTAAALKEDFPDYYKVFQTAFRSLTLTADLMGNIPQLERKENLKVKLEELLLTAQQDDFQEKHWLPFQEMVISSFADMGAFWQVLFLRDLQEKVLALAPTEVIEETTQEIAAVETALIAEPAAASSADIPQEIAAVETALIAEPAAASSADIPQEIAASEKASIPEPRESIEENPQVALE